MKTSSKIVRAPKGSSAKPSIAVTCEKVCKTSLYLLAFLLPLFFLPWTANVLEFNKQALLIFLVFISVFAWLLKTLIVGKVKINFSLVHIPVGVLFLVYLVSTIFSSWRYGSFWGWPQVSSESLITIMCLVLLYLLVVNVFEKKEIFYLLAFLVFSGALAGFYAILQIFGKFIVPISFTKNINFNSVGSVNILGIFAAVLLPLAITMAVVSKNRIHKILFIISALIFSAIFLLLNFYIVWWLVITGAALIFVFGMQKRDVFDNRWLILPMFFLAIGLLFSLPIFNFKIPGTPDISSEVFLKQKPTMDIALKSLQKRPVIGSGPGTFMYNFAKFKDSAFNQGDLWNIRFEWGSSKALTLLATTGILGTLAFLALIGFFIFYGIIFLFKRKEIEDLNFVWSLGMGVFVSFLALSIGYFLYQSNTTLDFAYFLLMASFVALVFPGKKEVELKPSSLAALGFTFAITIVFVFGLGLFILEGQRYASSANYLKGLALWQEGRFDAALVEIEKAVSISPGVDLFWRNLSQLYLQNIDIVANRGDLTEEEKRQAVQLSINRAVNAGKASSDVNPANVINWSSRGNVYQNMIGTVGGTKDWAVESYKEAMALDPANPFYPTQAGVSILKYVALLPEEQNQEREELLAEAEYFFNKAIDVKSDYAPAHFQLSRVYSAQQKQDEMIASLEKAKQLAPRDVGLAFQLGLVYYQKEEFQKARLEFERAVILSPNYSNALYFLGLVYDEVGEKDLASQAFERILQLNPGHEAAAKIYSNLKAGKRALSGIDSEEPEEIPIEEIEEIEE